MFFKTRHIKLPLIYMHNMSHTIRLKMTSLFYLTCSSSFRCLSMKQDAGHEYQKSIKMNGININSSFHDVNKGPVAAATSTVVADSDVCMINSNLTKEKEKDKMIRPTKKQLVDPYRQGVITEGGVGYRQTVVVRSYEVGADKTATIETILNLFQETALNHVWMSGLLGDGFGATHGMMRNNLIWVVSRMKVQVQHYPIWGEILEIETWVGSSGKNGMRRDWLLRSHSTGHVYAQATSTWVMMNQQSRRLSKMPDEVRAEISPWFIEKYAIQEEEMLSSSCDKIQKLDNTAKYIHSGLQPKRSDLDMNQHVNNVKYVRWMLETIPDSYLDSHELTELVLEYKRECGNSDVVQSLCHPNRGGGILEDHGINNNNKKKINGFSFSSEILQANNGQLRSLNPRPSTTYTHLLRIDGVDTKNEEIVRGKTIWKKKLHVP